MIRGSAPHQMTDCKLILPAKIVTDWLTLNKTPRACQSEYLLMDRRDFFKLFGLSAAAVVAERAFPFRVYSFPSKIVIPGLSAAQSVALGLPILFELEKVHDCFPSVAFDGLPYFETYDPGSFMGIERAKVSCKKFRIPMQIHHG